MLFDKLGYWTLLRRNRAAGGLHDEQKEKEWETAQKHLLWKGEGSRDGVHFVVEDVFGLEVAADGIHKRGGSGS